MKYRLIEAEKAEHAISRLCKVLGVTRQGFYAWRRRGPSLRQLGDEELKRLIVTIYDGSLQTYGAPLVQLDLRDDHDVHRPGSSTTPLAIHLARLRPHAARVGTRPEHG
jgi:putative transposase